VADAYYFPLARAVMGGLAASTLLTLVVLPTFYVLAENNVRALRRALAWGRGTGPLPWRRPPLGGGDSTPAPGLGRRD
jgi:hypothetical protein